MPPLRWITITFTCVGEDNALRETIFAVLNRAQGKLFVDCSTVHSDTTGEVASKLKQNGASFVASPVFGAPAIAEGGLG